MSLFCLGIFAEGKGHTFVWQYETLVTKNTVKTHWFTENCKDYDSDNPMAGKAIIKSRLYTTDIQNIQGFP